MSATNGVKARRPVEPRLDFAPVFDVLGTRNVAEVARRLGKDRAQVTRLVNDGLTPGMADEIAVAAGTHPAALWPDWEGKPVAASNRPHGGSASAPPVAPRVPLIELAEEEPPAVERRTLVEQAVALVGGCKPGRWYRVAVMPTERSAKMLATKLGKHAALTGADVRAGGLKVYVRMDVQP